MYHIVCPAKYCYVIISEEVEHMLKEVCEGINRGHEIRLLEVGARGDHMYFLVQSIPMYNPIKTAIIIKNIFAREIFKKHSEVKKAVVGRRVLDRSPFYRYDEQTWKWEVISNYVKAQGLEATINNYKR